MLRSPTRRTRNPRLREWAVRVETVTVPPRPSSTTIDLFSTAWTLRSIKAKGCVPGRCVDETQTVSPGENFGMGTILTSFAEAWV